MMSTRPWESKQNTSTISATKNQMVTKMRNISKHFYFTGQNKETFNVKIISRRITLESGQSVFLYDFKPVV